MGRISNFRRRVRTPACRARYRSVSHRPEWRELSENLKCTRIKLECGNRVDRCTSNSYTGLNSTEKKI